MKEIEKSELYRLQTISSNESRLKSRGFQHIAGVDEAGRGPLAGPVVAAACVLLNEALIPFLNDSKLLSKEKRESLYSQITSSPFVCFGIGIVDVETIDRINILQASLLAMQRAVESLSIKPDYILIDGNRSPYFTVPSEAIVKGDRLSISIAAASIVAKVTRDRMMDELHTSWPDYGFSEHKGYGTAKHLQAIKQLGPCPIHRKTFEPIKSSLSQLIRKDLF